MRIGINPWLNMVFKQLFGSEANKALLFSLVNAVLEQTIEKLVAGTTAKAGPNLGNARF